MFRILIVLSFVWLMLAFFANSSPESLTGSPYLSVPNAHDEPVDP